MIKFIVNDCENSDIFKEQVFNQDSVVFAPKLVHTGSFTIESYFSFGKPEFDFQSIEALYQKFELPRKTTLLYELQPETLLFIHYWSNLLITSERTILELPNTDFSESFILDLKELLSHYDQREISIITNNERVLELLKHADNCSSKQLPTYSLKIRLFDIVNRFIGERLLIFDSLLIAILIILSTLVIDSKLTADYTTYLDSPTNMIFVYNTSSSCEYNQVAYSLNPDDCFESKPLTYKSLADILKMQDVNSVIFDDAYNISKLDAKLTSNAQATASIPKLDYSLGFDSTSLPCLNENETPSNVTCTDYSPTNSLISIATLSDSTNLNQNLRANNNVVPQQVAIQTDNTGDVAKKLATMYPSINIYTNKSVKTYIYRSNSMLILKVLLSGTILSICAVLILNLLLSQLKLYLRGQKYLLSYLTKQPIRIHRLFYISQICYLGLLFIIGSLIAINLTETLTAFLISSYFGLLNIVLWILFSDINGSHFRSENKKLYNSIKPKN